MPVLRTLALVLVLVSAALPGLGAAALAAAPERIDLPEAAQDAERLQRQLGAKLDFAVAAGASTPESRVALHRSLEGVEDPNRVLASLEALAGAGLALPDDWMDLARLYRARGRLEEARGAAWLAAAQDEGPATQPALLLLAEIQEGMAGGPATIAWLEALPADLVGQELQERLANLRARYAVRFQRVQVDLDRPRPQVCLLFTGRLSLRQPLPLGDYLEIAPAAQVDATLEGDRLCLTGLRHGTDYRVTLRPGLETPRGERLEGVADLEVAVGNRTPSAGFQTGAYVLPAGEEPLVPVTTVNAAALDLTLYRVGARNLLTQIEYQDVGRQLGGYDLERIAESEGERLWEGALEVPEGAANREQTTLIPLDEIVPRREPGVYILTAEVAGREAEAWAQVATQWLVVSDIGLNLFEGRDGLTVFARSFADAGPMAGVELSLIARNNEELATVSTGPDGQGRFPAGLLRGAGGNRPAALYAHTPGGDFTFLDLQGPALDLSERGVAGRAAPGPVEAFVTPERGIYRPGETLHLTALLRRDTGVAMPGVPLTLRVVRADGVEAYRVTGEGDGLGGHVFAVPLDTAVPTGLWTAEVYLDPEAAPVGSAEFIVEDFVPQRLEMEASADRERLVPGEGAVLELEGRWLFGAPAADLPVRGTATVAKDPQPFPDYADWSFGLPDEEVTPQRERLPATRTDADGKALVPLELPRVPDVASPLAATVTVGLLDGGGRAVEESLKLPLRPRGAELGLKPRFSGGSVAAGGAAQVDLIALDPAGEPVSGREVQVEWIEVRTDWIPYWSGGTRWRRVETEIPLETASVTTGQDGRALIERPLDWGDYKLRVVDAEGAATAVSVRAGWRPAVGETDVPDALEVTPETGDLRPGETLEAFVKAPFAGRALVTVLRDTVLHSFEVELPAGGTTVEVPVEAGWAPGAYLAVTAYRPRRDEAAGPPSARAPARAMGAAWVTVDKPAHTLDVSLDPPEEIRPRQELTVPVEVAGAEGQPVHLVLAAVDEGVLQITDFETPDPLEFVFAQRRLGLDLRDLYGKLIDPADGPRGEVRSGGGGPRNLGSVTTRTTEVVSLFAGPVQLGPDGTAAVTLQVPDFNGRLRVMAMAWSLGGLGAAAAPVTVRDPVVADLVLPRFLALDDRAEATLELHNLSGAAGIYRVSVSAGDPVTLDFGTSVELAAGARTSVPVPLVGAALGSTQVQLSLQGPGGFDLERSWGLQVRAPQPYVSWRDRRLIAAGETVTLDDDVLDGYVPGTLDLSLSVSDRPDFDVPGLLASLTRYPYGCVEQTVSRALPLVYLPGMAEDWRVALDWSGEKVRDQVREAIGSVLARQTAAGGFGLWSASGGEDLWLSAYAVDFLTRARDEGYAVPGAALERAFAWMAGQASSDWNDDLAGRAYAFLVLARNGQVEAGDLRYFAEEKAGSLPTPAARLQLAAALAAIGERERAGRLFAIVEGTWVRQPERLSGWDYGSPLRDAALAAALMAEAGQTSGAWAAAERAENLLAQRRRLSTQEELWLLLAARGLESDGERLELALDGEAVQAEGRLSLSPGRAELAEGLELTNFGRTPLRLSLGRVGVPDDPLPPAENGLTLARQVLDFQGEPLDFSSVRQNDQAVVVLSGRVTDGREHQALLVDLLPAGFEIESVLAGGGSTEGLTFLPELTAPRYEARRDDRYVAAVDLLPEEVFTVAYVVRAVTPGEFLVPPPFVEDMYAPEVFARGTAGHLSVARLE
jgi:uncharacterized protein YfaS (alpha-2-macroglobulin family)